MHADPSSLLAGRLDSNRRVARQLERRRVTNGRIEYWFDAVPLGSDGPADSQSPPIAHDPLYVRVRVHRGAEEPACDIFPGDADRQWLPGDTMPDGLAGARARAARDALRGRAMREEFWSLDDAGRPEYLLLAIERAYRVHDLAAGGGVEQAEFLVAERETMSRHYERCADDPRVTHALVLEVDSAGFATRRAAVAYPRRRPACPAQAETLVRVEELDVFHHTPRAEAAPAGIVTETRVWQVDGLQADDRAPVTAARLLDVFVSAGLDGPPRDRSRPRLARRLIARRRHRFWNDARSAPLRCGEAGARAELCRCDQLALDASLADRIYGGKLDASISLAGAGYVASEGSWWIVTPAGGPAPIADRGAGSIPDPRDPADLDPLAVRAMRSLEKIAAVHRDAFGRTRQIELVDGALRRTEFQPWQRIEWDENDTVLESRWFRERCGEPGAGDRDRRAARLAAGHANTPASAQLDGFGRVVARIEDAGDGERCETRFARDGFGRTTAITDGRGIETESRIVDLTGRVIERTSADAGRETLLLSPDGRLLATWRADGSRLRDVHDARGRLTHRWVRDGHDTGERLAERIVYGDALPPEEARSRGAVENQIYQHYDGAGVVTFESYDACGRPLCSTRQMAADPGHVDWTLLAEHNDAEDLAAAARPALAVERLTTRVEYDDDGRARVVQHPDGVELVYRYNEAGHLAGVGFRAPEMAAIQAVVAELQTSASGQRRHVAYANGVRTTYAYDPLTSRLAAIDTRSARNRLLQSVRYTHDAVGNIVQVDHASPGGSPPGGTKLSTQYVYDGLYRLVEARGTEASAPAAPRGTRGGLRDYVQRLAFDKAGNLTSLEHQSGQSILHRVFHLDPRSNRLLATTERTHAEVTGRSHACAYDACGNTLAAAGLRAIEWNHHDQIRAATIAGDGRARFAYDGGGRVACATFDAHDTVRQSLVVGNWRLDRVFAGGRLIEQRSALQVVEGSRPLAVIESVSVEKGHRLDRPERRVVYQHDNHLGDVTMEIDGAGRVLRRRELHPYGTPAWCSGNESQGGRDHKPSRRRRAAAGMCDSGLSLVYRGARFYAPGLGRWLSCDPAGTLDGPNRYAYVNNRVVNLRDPSGRYGEAGHYYSVYFTSLHAGFDPDAAYRNAFYSQMTDEVFELDAIPVQGRVLLDQLRFKDTTVSAEDRRNVQLGLHALTGRPSDQETEFRERVIRNLSPATPIFGMALHAFGDSYSHRIMGHENTMYSPRWGHFKHGTEPDQIEMRPALFQEYALHLYRILVDLVPASRRQPRPESEFVAGIAQVAAEPDHDAQIAMFRQLSNTLLATLGHTQTMPAYAPEDFGGSMIHYGYTFAGLETENMKWQEYYFGGDMDPHWPVGDRQAAGMRGITLEKNLEVGRQWRFENHDHQMP